MWYQYLAAGVVLAGIFISIGMLKSQVSQNTKKSGENCVKLVKLREETMKKHEENEKDIGNLKIDIGVAKNETANIKEIVIDVRTDVKKILAAVGGKMGVTL